MCCCAGGERKNPIIPYSKSLFFFFFPVTTRADLASRITRVTFARRIFRPKNVAKICNRQALLLLGSFATLDNSPRVCSHSVKSSFRAAQLLERNIYLHAILARTSPFRHFPGTSPTRNTGTLRRLITRSLRHYCAFLTLLIAQHLSDELYILFRSKKREKTITCAHTHARARDYPTNDYRNCGIERRRGCFTSFPRSRV